MKNHIFISYRRDGGEIMAHTLHDKLTARGFQVFYDIESLKSGTFNTKLYEEIEACTDFILILPKNGLDNCRYEEDWVRREIAHALKHKKNIVSVFLRDFAFPMELPDEIHDIKYIQGVDFGTMDFFESKVDRIVEMLYSKPVYTNVRTSVGMQTNKIAVYGTNGDETEVPSDIRRFNSINMEEYENVCFSLDTTDGVGSLVEYTMVITDHEGTPIFDTKGLISQNEKNSGNNCVIIWKIKEEGYPLVAPGKYRVTIAIEQAEQCFAGFEITVALPKEENDKNKEGWFRALFKSRKRVTSVESHLSYPRGARLASLYVAVYLLFLTLGCDIIRYCENSMMVVAFLLLLCTVICFVRLFRYSQKYVFKNIFLNLAVLLIPYLTVPYLVVLIISAVKCNKICKKPRAIEKKIKEIFQKK